MKLPAPYLDCEIKPIWMLPMKEYKYLKVWTRSQETSYENWFWVSTNKNGKFIFGGSGPDDYVHPTYYVERDMK